MMITLPMLSGERLFRVYVGKRA